MTIERIDAVASGDPVVQELCALIGSVSFGSGGLRYRRLEVAAQLERLHDPVFLLAREHGSLVGGYVLDRRALLVDGQPGPGVYRGSLCVRAAYRGQGIGKALTAEARRWIDENSIVSWGCIDENNHPSLAVLGQAGARDSGGLAMPMFYRQLPRARCELSTFAPGRDPREQRVLDACHARTRLRDVTPSPLIGLALLDSDGVRVSARVAPMSYAIETMGAGTDLLVRLFVKPFPMARRRFDPDQFRHVRLVDVAVREGCERDWSAFVSTVLARFGLHIATTFIDPRSQLAQRLGVQRRVPSLRVMTRWSEPSAAIDPGTALALGPIDG